MPAKSKPKKREGDRHLTKQTAMRMDPEVVKVAKHEYVHLGMRSLREYIEDTLRKRLIKSGAWARYANEGSDEEGK